MNKKSDGGLAFGGVVEEWYFDTANLGTQMRTKRQVAGMSLRDYFAAQALSQLSHYSDLYDRGTAGVAKIAYEVADAMIAERARQ